MLFGGLWWGTQEDGNRLLQTPGLRRRFTGSHNVGQANGNSAFPVTMWMFDRPAVIDQTRWRLQVTGAVAKPLTFAYAELAALPQHEMQAILDCTGGWYSAQSWQGVMVDELLQQARLEQDALAISFVAVTGYRWSLPLGEARTALLALRVGGEALTHGHGAPLRLVAPGRRGFQWVKWVTEIKVLTATDWRQWSVIFTSGLKLP